MDRNAPDFPDGSVKAAFEAFPPEYRAGLLQLRALILETAATTDGVGRLEETLKWGQPAYLTPETKSGSTLRLGLPKTGGFAIYTHCQTTILSDFQSIFPTEFAYEGNRAIHFDPATPLDHDALRLLIASALTYKLRKTAAA